MRTLSLLLLLSACGSPGSVDDTGPQGDDVVEDPDPNDPRDTQDDPDPPPAACIPDPGPCPSGSPAIGAAGQFRSQSFALQWNDRRTDCGAWVSDPVYLTRAGDVSGYSLTVDGWTTDTAFGRVEVDGTPILDATAQSGPTAFYSPPFVTGWDKANTIVLPNGPDTAPSGSCVAVVAIADTDLDPSDSALHVGSRRYGQAGTLDVNIVIVDDTYIEEWELDEIAYHTGQAFAQAGITLGELPIFTVDMGLDGYVSRDGSDVDELRSVMPEGSEQAINLFIVQDIVDGGLFGFAGGIPGPVGVHGTAASGVVVSVDTHLSADMSTLDTAEFGATVAHEIGHQLGLFHTTERDGSGHDVLSDTPECPTSQDANADGVLSASECTGYGGDHVMFWTTGGVPQTRWSAQQSNVLTSSPAARP